MRPNEIISIPVGQLHESPFNPRRKKSKQGLQELADSIKAVGIIQPVTVRVVADGEGLPMADYQIVCGHRRFAAARMAGLTEVPCVIRIMTAEQARELAITENLQREDVDPFDESDAFALLTSKCGYSTDDLCIRFGKSKSYVRGRLGLQRLNALYRELYDAGQIPVTHCLFIARLEGDTQEELYERHSGRNTAPDMWMVPLSRIKAEVMQMGRLLKNAAFCTDRCEKCPYNTAACLLFPEDSEDAKCLNKKCYDSNMYEGLKELLTSAARKAGKLIVEKPYDETQKRVFQELLKKGLIQEGQLWRYEQEDCGIDDLTQDGEYGYRMWNNSFLRLKTTQHRRTDNGSFRRHECRMRAERVKAQADAKFFRMVTEWDDSTFKSLVPKDRESDLLLLKMAMTLCDEEDVCYYGLNPEDVRDNAKLQKLSREEMHDATVRFLMLRVPDEMVTDAMMDTCAGEIESCRAEATRIINKNIRKLFPNAKEISDEELEELIAAEIEEFEKRAGAKNKDTDSDEGNE